MFSMRNFHLLKCNKRNDYRPTISASSQTPKSSILISLTPEGQFLFRRFLDQPQGQEMMAVANSRFHVHQELDSDY